MAWAIETRFTYGWENVFREDEKLVTFPNFEAAEDALDDHLADLHDAFLRREIEDYSAGDYRIREVEP